jgi:hypothetical protein
MAYQLEQSVDRYLMEDGLGVYLLESEGVTTAVKMVAMRVQWAWMLLFFIFKPLL